jgi:hypothetical protein
MSSDEMWTADADVPTMYYENPVFKEIVEKRLREAFVKQTGHDRMSEVIWCETWTHMPDGSVVQQMNARVEERP